MAKRLFAIASVVLAAFYSLPALAANETGTATSAEQGKTDEIKLSLFGHRRTPNLYWRIGSSGKGEISAPQSIGYEVSTPLIVSPVYRIAPGVHSVDIGEAGYAELRAYLSQIVDGKYDRYGLSDDKCTLSHLTDSGWAELDWTGSAKGDLHLSHDCLNGLGQYFHDRMVSSWHVLAKRLHEQGQSLVTVEPQPSLRVPMSLHFTKRTIWTSVTTSWHITSNGKGWVEFSKDGSLPTLAVGESNFAKAGRHHFQLDKQFHQAVLRELDPYLSGTKTVGSCEDEISRTDQPMVRIEWTYKARKPASFASDMGCPSFAKRFGKVELAFAELIRQGRLGGSRILRGK